MDNFKIMYKVLRELEKNMGNEDFSIEIISAKSLNIPFAKWEQLLILMSDNGFVSGIITDRGLQDKYRNIVEPILPSITLKGLEYLSENSFMAKAKEALRLVGDII